MALVNLIKNTFHFKTEKLRNEKGEIVGDGKKHPSVQIDLPVPTAEAISAFFADTEKYAKELELLFGTLQDQVYRIARGQINDFREKNPETEVTAAALNYDKLDWSAIASMPARERTSSVPSDEDIKSFLDKYLEVMPSALDKPKVNIENHLLCFQSGFRKQRSQKEILEMFKDSLAVFVATVGDEGVAEHIECVEYFTSRLDKLLVTEEKITMDNL